MLKVKTGFKGSRNSAMYKEYSLHKGKLCIQYANFRYLLLG